MLLSLDRFISDSETTIGHLSVDGAFACFVLEDAYHKPKIPKQTRIWAGNYVVSLRTEGRKNQQYAERFKDVHRGMLWLRDVPEFEYILIHCGNTANDTEG